MPDWNELIRQRLATLKMHPADEAAIADELAQHAADRCEELISGGMDEATALHNVVAELDNMQPLAEALSARRSASSLNAIPPGASASGNPLSDFVRDIRYGLRAIRKSPSFTFFAVFTLALGIGANTTVFTIINTMLLNPLPVADPSRLVALFSTALKNAQRNGSRLPLSYPDLDDYAKQNSVFRGVAGFTNPTVLTQQQKTGPQRVFGEFVTGAYFDTLGIHPALGRFFLPEEDLFSGSAPVAVLSYNAWQQRLGGSQGAIGQILDINGVSFTVTGVAPQGFIGVSPMFGPDLWLPSTMSRTVLDKALPDPLLDRAGTAVQVFARLKDGVSRSQAQANLETIAAALRGAYPKTNENRAILVRPIAEQLFLGATSPGALYFGSAVLMGIVGLVLCIACSNVANLLLARAATRGQEIAVRLAMGASRSRLIRQSLAESILLSALGCIGGLAVGYAGCRFIWSFLPSEYLANFIVPKLDGSVLLFASAVSLATAFLFGAAPALRASRTDVVTALKEGSRAVMRSRRTVSFANVLLIGQVAFSLILLFTATLFLRSIERAYRIDPGFATDHLSIFMMNPEQAGYSPQGLKDFYDSVADRVAALPGTASVAWASGLPFWNSPSRSLFIEGTQTSKRTEMPVSVLFTVGTGYFQTLRIPLIEGRDFNADDRQTTLPVAIVNHELATKYWPRGDALNRRVQLADEKEPRQIVGIAKTANYTTLGERPQPCVYVPLRQNPVGGRTLYVRTKTDAGQILSAVQRVIHGIDPALPVPDVRTGAKLIDQVLFGPRIGVMLLGVFGSLGLALASVGLYGLMAYSVTRRRNELGVRMAVGASSRMVLGLVLRDGMKLVAIGIAFGLAGSLLVGRALARILFGIQPADPASIAGASLLLLLVGFVACYLPARAAGRVDPLMALRDT